MRIIIQQIIIDVFLNQTLYESGDCFFWFSQIKIAMQNGIKLKDITYQKVLLRITRHHQQEKTLLPGN